MLLVAGCGCGSLAAGYHNPHPKSPITIHRSPPPPPPSQVAWENLTAKEKAYALCLAQADWAGAKICLLQCSPESPVIFSLLQLVFSAQPLPDLVARCLADGLSQVCILRPPQAPAIGP